MGKYILKRLGYGLITLAAISVIIFSVIHLLPGDPIQIMFGKNPVPELIEIARKYYGLDKPIYVQYFSWLSKVVRGNLGYSIVNNLPVLELVVPRIGRTIMLTMSGIVLSLDNRAADRSCRRGEAQHMDRPQHIIGVAGAHFHTGILDRHRLHDDLRRLARGAPYERLFSPFVDLGNFVRIMILPAATVASVQAAQTTRMTRANMLEVLRLDYITLMKAMGIRNVRTSARARLQERAHPRVDPYRHAGRSPLGGVVIVEKVFTYPGLGLLMIKSLQERDYPVVQACIMVYAVLFVVDKHRG